MFWIFDSTNCIRLPFCTFLSYSLAWLLWLFNVVELIPIRIWCDKRWGNGLHMCRCMCVHACVYLYTHDVLLIFDAKYDAFNPFFIITRQLYRTNTNIYRGHVWIPIRSLSNFFPSFYLHSLWRRAYIRKLTIDYSQLLSVIGQAIPRSILIESLKAKYARLTLSTLFFLLA